MFKFIESQHCIITTTTIVKRSWKERLFSWPWRPRQATKEIAIQTPDPNLYSIDRFTIVGHPATIAQLKARLSEADQGRSDFRF